MAKFNIQKALEEFTADIPTFQPGGIKKRMTSKERSQLASSRGASVNSAIDALVATGAFGPGKDARDKAAEALRAIAKERAHDATPNTAMPPAVTQTPTPTYVGDEVRGTVPTTSTAPIGGIASATTAAKAIPRPTPRSTPMRTPGRTGMGIRENPVNGTYRPTPATTPTATPTKPARRATPTQTPGRPTVFSRGNGPFARALKRRQGMRGY